MGIIEECDLLKLLTQYPALIAQRYFNISQNELFINFSVFQFDLKFIEAARLNGVYNLPLAQ